MRIIIRQIPVSMSCQELERLVWSRTKTGWFRPFKDRPVISSCQIVRVSGAGKQEKEIFGLATVRPRSAAVRAIGKLNKVVLNNARIQAREFFDRTYQRDRRRLVPALGDGESAVERRKGDRRKNSVTEVICASGRTAAGSAYITTASLF